MLLKMVVWSCLSRIAQRNTSTVISTTQLKYFNAGIVQQRLMSGHRVLPLTPSRWQWHKFKDMFHYYLMVGLIPVGLIVLYTNIFIGPAKLTPIPEDYVPKHWEYYRHPITRFIARYIFPSPQQEHEKMLHQIYENDEVRKIRLLEDKINLKMAERHDYHGYYTHPVDARYYRVTKEASDYLDSLRGDN